MCEGGRTVSDYPNKSKFIALYRAMQNDHPSAKAQYDSLTEVLKVDFENFQVDAGNAFLQLKDDLDEAIADLGEDFTSEDPRNWTGVDWQAFNARIEGHKYEEIIRLYAEGKPNIHLIWKEIENRL
jgi:hypothetical protein